jgi:hypothetical protein
MKTKLHALLAIGAIAFFSGNEVHAQYCIPSYFTGCTDGDDIDNFTLTGSGLTHLGSGCSIAGYGDYTADMGLVANVQPSVSYPFSITHNFSNQYVKIWIDFNNDEVFDDGTELLFASATGSSNTTGSITIPYTVAPATGLRMRVMGRWNSSPLDACATGMSYGETHDYTVNILPPPPCQNPVLLTVTDASDIDAAVSWTEPGTATDYILEWGLPGFTPGTGAEIGTANVSGATNFLITGLSAVTSYDFYVRADCGVDGLSFWGGPLSFTTPCPAINTLPWSENFDASSLGFEVFPDGCWIHENYTMWNGFGVYDNGWNFGDADAMSGTQFLSAQYNSNSYVWTPEFVMSVEHNHRRVVLC